MYGLTKKEKLDFVLQKTKELDISAYEISKKTKLTEAGIKRILNGLVKNPHENSLDTIIEFLEAKVLGTAINEKIHIIEEPKEVYIPRNSRIEDLLKCEKEKNILTIQIYKLQNLLEKNNIPYKNFFEDEEN